MADGRVPLALTEEQQADLAAAIRSARSARVYRRLKVVQWLAEGYAVDAVMRLADASRSSVYNYLGAYARGGVAALEDAPRSGRPRKLPSPYAGGGPESHDAWQRLLDRRPSTIPELATPSHVWTLRLLARYMEAVHGAGVSEATIYKALSRAGFRRGRTKLSLTSPDPQYEVKRRKIEALGQGLAPAH
jgi:transposase